MSIDEIYNILALFNRRPSGVGLLMGLILKIQLYFLENPIRKSTLINNIIGENIITINTCVPIYFVSILMRLYQNQI